MLDILRTYLTDAASPENLEMIQEAHASLDVFGIQDYQDDFVQLLMLDDAVDHGETVQNIYDCTRNWQVNVLKLLGVEVSEDARVDHLTRLLNALHAVEIFEDPTLILERGSLELHPEELLAEILATASHTPPEEWLVDIETVSQMLIQKILENASQHATIIANGNIEEDEHRKKYINTYKDFRQNLFQNRTKAVLLMDKYFEQGMDVGYPYVVYLNLAGTEIGTLEVIDCAANMISMALISTDGHDRPREVIKAHLEHYVQDLDVLTKVDIAVNELLLRFQIDMTSGVKQA
jgi:hypothetical protein